MAATCFFGGLCVVFCLDYFWLLFLFFKTHAAHLIFLQHYSRSESWDVQALACLYPYSNPIFLSF